MKRLFTTLVLLVGLAAFSAEVIPPAPKLFFNDYAGVISSDVASQLNKRLEQFERDTSSQIVVAIFSKMQSDSSIEDYTFRVKESWKVGQKGKNNGAALFVFTQDRKMYLQVGYGLEGVLPDALCKRIIADEITPHFKTGDFTRGLSAGVSAILAAAKGEYKGTGRTVADGRFGSSVNIATMAGFFVFIVFFIFILIAIRRAARGGRIFTGGGYSSSSSWGVGNWGSSSGWSSSDSGGFSGGGGGGSDSGGFSGGGGSGGGGGAGGSW